jgi:hypothetical protein
MSKRPTRGNEIVEIRGHEQDEAEVQARARTDDQLGLLITERSEAVITVSLALDLLLSPDGEGVTAGEFDLHILLVDTRQLSRSIRLPFEVKEEKIDATLDDGVLTIRVQKLPVAPNRIARCSLLEQAV